MTKFEQLERLLMQMSALCNEKAGSVGFPEGYYSGKAIAFEEAAELVHEALQEDKNDQD
jgi:hypothetical protein